VNAAEIVIHVVERDRQSRSILMAVFRQYAKEGMHGSCKVKDGNEKQALVDLALTWAQTALMSDRVLGSSFVSSLCDVSEAASHTGKKQHAYSRLRLSCMPP